jgi:hypothetical protein
MKKTLVVADVACNWDLRVQLPEDTYEVLTARWKAARKERRCHSRPRF